VKAMDSELVIKVDDAEELEIGEGFRRRRSGRCRQVKL
jgi:hypothetical protein